MKTAIAIILIVSILISQAHGGLLAYGICQTGCNAVAVACYGVSCSELQSTQILNEYFNYRQPVLRLELLLWAPVFRQQLSHVMQL